MCRAARESERVLCLATAWDKRPHPGQPAAHRADAVLHQQTREAYGARKIWQALRRDGIACGRHRVARLRRLAGIVALRRRRYIRTVQVRQHATLAIPNRLNQQFAVSAKNRAWAGDLTLFYAGAMLCGIALTGLILYQLQYEE